MCAWNTKTARCNLEICKDSQKSFIEDIWCDRLDAIFRKDYHFLAIRESNRAVLYITGIFALWRGSPRPRQDLPFVSFVPGARRTRKASPRRLEALEERLERRSSGSSGPIINLPNRISSASGRLEKVDTPQCPYRVLRSAFSRFSLHFFLPWWLLRSW